MILGSDHERVEMGRAPESEDREAGAGMFPCEGASGGWESWNGSRIFHRFGHGDCLNH